MPKIVDKVAVRKHIVVSFQECLKDKAFDKITIRDIANKAKLPHTTILNYFNTKQEIIQAYAEYVAEYTYRAGNKWLNEHHAADYASPEAYIKAFLTFCKKCDTQTRLVYTGALNIYASGQTNKDLAAYVKEEQNLWNNENFSIICKELKLPEVNRMIGNYIFACVQSICMISYNDWIEKPAFDQLLTLYAKTIMEYLCQEQNEAGKGKEITF